MYNVECMRDIWSLLAATFRDWYEDRAQRLGAALAYYTIFALTPGLVLVIALAGFLLGQDAEGQILGQIRELIGEQGAAAIEATTRSARTETLGVAGTALALFPLVFGLWGLFGELQDGLNTIWGVTPKAGRRVIEIVKERFWSFAMVVGIGFLLLVSLAMSAWLIVVGTYFGQLLPAPAAALELLNFVISFGVITVLFAMTFKLLPDVTIAWRDVWPGAALTSLLFTAWQVRHRPLSREKRGGIGVRGRRLPRHHRGLGLLLGADPAVWRRVHQSVDETAGFRVRAG